jgi:hypothetical protein
MNKFDFYQICAILYRYCSFIKINTMEMLRIVALILFIGTIIFVSQAFNLERYPLLEKELGDTVMGLGVKLMSLGGIIFLILGGSYLVYPKDSRTRTAISAIIVKIMGFCCVVGLLIVCAGVIREVINMP